MADEGALVFAKTIHNFVSSARNEYGFEASTRTFTLDSDVDVAADITEIGSDTSYSLIQSE